MTTNPYARGPAGGRAARSPKPSAAAGAIPSPVAVDTLPTTWKPLPGGRRVMVNPNRCMICRAPRHADTAHHAFTPDEADAAEAAALGWPTPKAG